MSPLLPLNVNTKQSEWESNIRKSKKKKEKLNRFEIKGPFTYGESLLDKILSFKWYFDLYFSLNVIPRPSFKHYKKYLAVIVLPSDEMILIARVLY